MQKCILCGSNYTPKNTEQKYCSGACKSKASRERRKTNLSDTDLTNHLFTHLPVTSSIVSDLANTAVRGVVGQFQPNICDVVKTLKDPSVPKTNKFILVGGGVAGGIVGYQFAGKGRRLGGTILGAFIGVGAGKLIHWLFQDEVIESKPELTSLSDTPYQLLTSSDISRMQILTISFAENTVLGQLVGESLNERFSILLYGEAGGGKSHLATRIAGELG